MKPRCWIVDTNVVVAAILAPDDDAPPARVLRAMRSGELRFVLSVELLAEYRQVLLRARIRSRHGLSDNEVDDILHELATQAVIADISARTETAPDPGDNHPWKLLATRPAAGLITGDRLLIDNPPPGRSVIAPRDLARQL